MCRSPHRGRTAPGAEVAHRPWGQSSAALDVASDDRLRVDLCIHGLQSGQTRDLRVLVPRAGGVRVPLLLVARQEGAGALGDDGWDPASRLERPDDVPPIGGRRSDGRRVRGPAGVPFHPARFLPGRASAQVARCRRPRPGASRFPRGVPRDLIRGLDVQGEALPWAAMESGADCVSAVWPHVDRAQHFFWQFRDTDHELSDAVDDVYVAMDRATGSVLEAFPGADVVVVSDHGAGRLKGDVNVGAWLARQRPRARMEGRSGSRLADAAWALPPAIRKLGRRLAPSLGAQGYGCQARRPARLVRVVRHRCFPGLPLRPVAEPRGPRTRPAASPSSGPTRCWMSSRPVFWTSKIRPPASRSSPERTGATRSIPAMRRGWHRT